MISAQTYTLANGLRLVHNHDRNTRFAVVNVLYKVGSRDEEPQHTGMAHLFEHLMFGGTPTIPHFDGILQSAGGNSNAWTDTDFTNYYDEVPIHNIETALWLEADRMAMTHFPAKSLEVQRNVVIEEFKERCLNKPYGDVPHIMRNNAFKHHTYRWPTIGATPQHIADVSQELADKFFNDFYTPSNAVLSVVGDIDFDSLVKLVEKYIGHIKPRKRKVSHYDYDELTGSSITVNERRDVPHNAIYKYFMMPGRFDADYVAVDMLTEILASGRSSRFYSNITGKGRGFSTIDSSIIGCIDPGALIVNGRLLSGVSFEEGEDIIRKELDSLTNVDVSCAELEKCVNKLETNRLLNLISCTERAFNLAYYTMLGDANLINTEIDEYRKLTPTAIKETAKRIFCTNRCITLHYGPNA